MFNRQAALDAGYTPEEIDAYLASTEPQINAPELPEDKREGFTGAISSMIAGTGRQQYDMPEFDLPFEWSGRQAKTALGLLTTFNPKREVEILRSNYPKLKFTKDKFDNVIVDGTEYGGSVGYLNKPGISGRDLLDMGFQVASFTPAGKLAAASTGAKRLATGGLASGTTQVGLDVTGQATTDEDIRFGRIDLGDVATATLGGVLGEGAGMLASKYLPQWSRQKSITDEMRTAFKQAAKEAGKNVDEVTDQVIQNYLDMAEQSIKPEIMGKVRATEQFGIPYTKGQLTGDIKQLQLEDSLRHGGMSAEAQGIMNKFQTETQNPAILAAQAREQARLSGGRNVIESIPESGSMIREGIINRAQQMEQLVNEAYGEVGDAFLKPQGLKKVVDNLRRIPKAEMFEVNKDLAPGTVSLIGQLDDMSQFLDEAGGIIKPYHIKKLESFRKIINNKIDAAPNNTDRGQLRQLKRAYDDSLDIAIEKSLFTGDEQALDALKKARGLHSQYMKKYTQQPIKTRTGKITDDVGKVMERLVYANPTDEEVVNYLFGTSKLGGKKVSADLSKHLKRTLGEDSNEWKAIREAAFLKLTQPGRGQEIPSGKVILSRLQDAELNNPTLLKTLFSGEDIGRIREFGKAIKTAQPDPLNPSKSSYKLSQLAQQMWENIATSFGYAQGGAVGGMGARQATRGMSNYGARRQAAKAIQPMRPLRDMSYTNWVAPIMTGEQYRGE